MKKNIVEAEEEESNPVWSPIKALSKMASGSVVLINHTITCNHTKCIIYVTLEVGNNECPSSNK